MTNPLPVSEIQLIPIEAINIVNPRVRNKRIFKEIVTSIAEVGLKRPITVIRRNLSASPHYDLVCGQGRLEAFEVLGQHEIPAHVIETDLKSGLLMSLVENLARRQHRAIDLLHDIAGMKRRGHSAEEIVRMTGLSLEYVQGVTRLIEAGEDRLLKAVEAGQIPVSVAVQIADAEDADTQRVLQQAYESKLLRGRKFLAAKRLVTQRRRTKKLDSPKRSKPKSVDALLKTYREDTDKKRLLVSKAEAARDRLIFVTEALRKLFADENFRTLLRAESLDSLPKSLADRLELAHRG